LTIAVENKLLFCGNTTMDLSSLVGTLAVLSCEVRAGSGGGGGGEVKLFDTLIDAYTFQDTEENENKTNSATMTMTTTPTPPAREFQLFNFAGSRFVAVRGTSGGGLQTREFELATVSSGVRGIQPLFDANGINLAGSFQFVITGRLNGLVGRTIPLHSDQMSMTLTVELVGRIRRPRAGEPDQVTSFHRIASAMPTGNVLRPLRSRPATFSGRIDVMIDSPHSQRHATATPSISYSQGTAVNLPALRFGTAYTPGPGAPRSRPAQGQIDQIRFLLSMSTRVSARNVTWNINSINIVQINHSI
jgi:hypothetical protein